MSISPLDLWFSSLTVAQKEHIARKVSQKQSHVLSALGPDPHRSDLPSSFKDSHSPVLSALGPEPPTHTYPSCTRIWIDLSDADKQFIHDHCTDDHGIFITPENLDTHHGFDF